MQTIGILFDFVRLIPYRHYLVPIKKLYVSNFIHSPSEAN